VIRRTAATALATAALIGCSSHSDVLKGPGGISYRWPPPAGVLAAPPSTSRFCTLLIDDYQHLKTAQVVHGQTAKQRVLQDYVALGPTLEAAAPAPIDDAVRTYVGAVSTFIQALIAHGLDVLSVPSSDLAPLSTPAVKSAASALTSFSSDECHYDLAANSTPATQQGGTHA
jgi:hypothetical protein